MTQTNQHEPIQPTADPERGPGNDAPPSERIPFLRLSITGVFMGLANLVPGVSGGTMVLALGLYDEFIGAVGDVTRLRIRPRPVIVLALLFGIALVTIVGLSSVVQYLMEMFLPGMLALFIGMTLGGSPLIYKETRPFDAGAVVAAVAAFVGMGLLAFVFRPDTGSANFLLYFLGGVIGSSAMILPGISGSYLLLIMGLYLPIIRGISTFKDGLAARDLEVLWAIGLEVLLPVGLGLVIGIAVLSNVLGYLLRRQRKVTLGFLFGLLLGSVLGLFPFKAPSFAKLPRYAAVEGGTRLLTVMPFGFDTGEESRIYSKLKELEREGVEVRLLGGAADRAPALEDLEVEERPGVVIAYDVDVPAEVRQAAEDAEIELMIVPNTEFTPGKGVLVLVLIGVGFAITYALGRMAPQEKDQPPQVP